MKLFFLYFFFSSNSTFAQTVPKSDFDFIIEKIKTVYAGYKEKSHGFDELVFKVKSEKSLDTFASLSKLTVFFKDQHLNLYQPFYKKDIDTNKCKKNYNSINNKIGTKKYEGYWIDDLNNTIIYLKNFNKIFYEGYMIESRANVPQGFCILKMKRENRNELSTDLIDLNESFRVFAISRFKSEKVLLCNSYYKWKKLDNYSKDFLLIKKEFGFNPSFKQLSKDVSLINMPSFSRKYINIYDSIFNRNKDIIANSPTLIIDIRNNSGGFINNFFSLFAFICTQNIIRTGSLRLCSEYLITDTQKSIDKYLKSGDSIKANVYKEYLLKLIGRKGVFLYIPPDILFECKTDSFKQLKNVAIIMNNACISAAELMVIYFSQSNKVKTFGESTGGGVDFLDTYRFQTPQMHYNLFLATTKRELTKSFPAYDKTGISPDVEISDDIEDWVDFVKRYYGKN